MGQVNSGSPEIFKGLIKCIVRLSWSDRSKAERSPVNKIYKYTECRISRLFGKSWVVKSGKFGNGRQSRHIVL